MATQFNTDEIIDRIRFLIRKGNMTQADFARRIGVDPTNMSKHLHGRLPITRGLINRIAVDMGVSKQWLIDGSETPYAKHPTRPHDMPRSEVGRGVKVPIYDIDVTAGNVELSRMLTADRVIGSISLPHMDAGSAIVHVSGDSMTPDIRHGSYIAIRRVAGPDNIFWGQIYVIVLDDYRLVKFLRRHPSDPSLVVLHSANPAYDDMEVPVSDIRALYLVQAVLNFDIRC